MIGAKIRAARKAAGLSQEQLGFESKLSRNYISMIELDQASPTLDTLLRICHAAGIRAATLVDEVERSLSDEGEVAKRLGRSGLAHRRVKRKR